MKILKPALLALWLALPAGAETLNDVLNRMDQASSQFKAVTGNIRQLSHTDVVNEDDVATGTISMKRVKAHDVRMLINLTQPDPKMVSLQEKSLSIYLPKIATVQNYDVGKNRSLLEQFLLLGFGATRAELEAAYEIHWIGEETVNGVKTGHMELTPKSPEVLHRVKKIGLWLSESTGYPAQHKIFMPGNDYWLVNFSNLKLNPNLPDTALKLKLPKGVKQEYPQR